MSQHGWVTLAVFALVVAGLLFITIHPRIKR